MIITLAGLVLSVTFVACVAAVLGLMAEIARDTPQGGTVAVMSAPAWAAVARPAPARRAEYVGRHRK